MFGRPKRKKPKFTSVEVGVLHVTLVDEQMPFEVGLALHGDFKEIGRILCGERKHEGPYNVKFYNRSGGPHRPNPLLDYRETIGISPEKISSISLTGIFTARLHTAD
ncbi:MAG: hypothetical protein PVI21_05655 [Candidatus Woesebacteria bacterium]|jgi:hypothetical protein